VDIFRPGSRDMAGATARARIGEGKMRNFPCCRGRLAVATVNRMVPRPVSMTRAASRPTRNPLAASSQALKNRFSVVSSNGLLTLEPAEEGGDRLDRPTVPRPECTTLDLGILAGTTLKRVR